MPSEPPSHSAHLEALVHTLADAAVLLASDGATILAANGAFCALMRRPEEAMIGTSARLLAGEPRGERRARLVEQARATRREIVFEDDGVYGARLEHHVVPIAPGAAEVDRFLWIARDVTAERRAIGELAQSEARLNEAQRLAQLGNWEFDLTTQEGAWSDEICRIFRFERDDKPVTYEAFLSLVHAEDREAVDRVYRHSLETRSPYAITHRIRLADGEIRWVQERCQTVYDDDGKPLKSFGTLQDVTERALAEQEWERAEWALRDSEARFRALLDRLPDAVIVHRDGQCVYANATALQMLGFERAEDLLALSISAIAAPESVPAVLEAMQDPLRPVGPVEGRWIRRDGTTFSVEVLAIRVPFDGIPARVVVARDVSARKDLHARIAQMDRMIAVGTLAAGVGHEINNPLAYLMGNLEFVSDELSELGSALRSSTFAARLDEVRTALAEAREGAERVRRIVRDLRSFSSVGHSVHKSLEVHAVIDSAVNMAWNELRHRARLIKQYGLVPDVEANESRLAQVFLNLLVNAAQAIPEGNAAAHEVHVVTFTDEAGRAVVEVRDTGSGIPVEVAGRVFDPFFTTKPVGVGTGLGLSICHTIVHALGGEITFKALDPNGTAFFVRLPAARRTSPPQRAPAPGAEGARRARILVVDDEPLVGRTLLRGLPEHDVTHTTRGQELLERLAKGEQFDVILCDLMMPDLSGMDLYETIRTRFPEHAPRMVFVTGGAFTPRAREFLDQRPVPRIDKPFTMAGIREALRALLP